MIARAHAGETLDALCWRMLGATADVTEATLALNPGLAGGGLKLAEGQSVTLPAPSTVASATRESVKLWD